MTTLVVPFHCDGGADRVASALGLQQSGSDWIGDCPACRALKPCRSSDPAMATPRTPFAFAGELPRRDRAPDRSFQDSRSGVSHPPAQEHPDHCRLPEGGRGAAAQAGVSRDAPLLDRLAGEFAPDGDVVLAAVTEILAPRRGALAHHLESPRKISASVS